MTDTRQPELSLERFEALVESYGGDIDRFPTRERTAARALVLRSREARRMLDAARALDAVLASTRDGLPSAELERALLEIPRMHAQERRVPAVLPFRSRTRTLLAAAAVLVAGVWSARMLPDEEPVAALGAEDEVTTLATESEVAALDADQELVAFADELWLGLGEGDALEEGMGL